RYADDFVILCRTRQDADRALALVQRWVEDNGLTLHPTNAVSSNCLVRGWRSDLNRPLLQPWLPLEPLFQALFLRLRQLDPLGILLGTTLDPGMHAVVGHVAGVAQHRRLAVQQLPTPGVLQDAPQPL